MPEHHGAADGVGSTSGHSRSDRSGVQSILEVALGRARDLPGVPATDDLVVRPLDEPALIRTVMVARAHVTPARLPPWR
jgi:hypothetical protein